MLAHQPMFPPRLHLTMPKFQLPCTSLKKPSIVALATVPVSQVTPNKPFEQETGTAHGKSAELNSALLASHDLLWMLNRRVQGFKIPDDSHTLCADVITIAITAATSFFAKMYFLNTKPVRKLSRNRPRLCKAFCVLTLSQLHPLRLLQVPLLQAIRPLQWILAPFASMALPLALKLTCQGVASFWKCSSRFSGRQASCPTSAPVSQPLSPASSSSRGIDSYSRGLRDVEQEVSNIRTILQDYQECLNVEGPDCEYELANPAQQGIHEAQLNDRQLLPPTATPLLSNASPTSKSATSYSREMQEAGNTKTKIEAALHYDENEGIGKGDRNSSEVQHDDLSESAVDETYVSNDSSTIIMSNVTLDMPSCEDRHTLKASVSKDTSQINEQQVMMRNIDLASDANENTIAFSGGVNSLSKEKVSACGENLSPKSPPQRQDGSDASMSTTTSGVVQSESPHMMGNHGESSTKSEGIGDVSDERGEAVEPLPQEMLDYEEPGGSAVRRAEHVVTMSARALAAAVAQEGRSRGLAAFEGAPAELSPGFSKVSVISSVQVEHRD